MASNSSALTCLCLALGSAALAQTTLGQTPPGQTPLGQTTTGQATAAQARSDVFVTNQRSLSVPVNIQEARRAELRELVLYASNDQGRTWQQVASMPPNQNAFTFNAPLDGTYWLKAAVVNRLGKQEPENIYQVPPDQKFVVDTMKPLLRLNSPLRQGDDVALTWELQEENPEWATFRLEYQAKDRGPTWTPIQATAGLTGQTRFRPTIQGPITVRLSFRDQAGNQSFAQADVAGTITTATFTQTPESSGMPPLPMFPGVSPPTLPPPGELIKTPPAPLEQKTFPMTTPTNLLPTPPVALPAAQAPVVAAPWSAPATATKADTDKVVASSVAPPAAPVVAAAAPPARSLPALQYVNHSEVTLEYELARIGPSGVGTIELWWTQNDGQSWELYAIDPEAKSGSVANGRHKRTVELPGDGLYGFNLIVKSKAGLGKAPPRTGDAPELRMEVDTTAPIAQLYEAKADSQRPGTLLLKWNAKDNNLTNTILLEWSAKREGPWNPIASPPANLGKHSWTLPDGLPVQVYLRLRVRDLAGNESVATTAEPQLVDLSEPEGRLVNVSVAPR